MSGPVLTARGPIAFAVVEKNADCQGSDRRPRVEAGIDEAEDPSTIVLQNFLPAILSVVMDTIRK